MRVNIDVYVIPKTLFKALVKEGLTDEDSMAVIDDGMWKALSYQHDLEDFQDILNKRPEKLKDSYYRFLA
jgi:hypothetical protein